MLLIGTTNVALADWDPGDGHKMHWPQLPDPNGWDVDFGWWALGDDWECSETGTVDDIHFWISFYNDEVVDPIPWIKVSIWSNNPHGPQGWSEPLNMLWTRTFDPGQFTIRDPEFGDQGWLIPPYMEFYPNNHLMYFQVNIQDIDDPFEQVEGEIYWLVIQMPFEQEWIVGWKTTLIDLQFQDFAVWSAEPGYEWWEIPGFDLAFVITGEDKHCNLTIRSVTGGFLDTPQTTTVDAVLVNTGNAPCYNVTWSFTFNGGIILSGPIAGTIPVIPPGGTVTVSSNLVIGLVIPFLLPGTVTVTATCPPAPAVTATKNVLAIILLCKVS